MIIKSSLEELLEYGIRFANKTTLGAWGSKQNITIECPIQFRGGIVDVGNIGAFSYLGEGRSNLQHIGKIGRFCAIGPDVVTGHQEHVTDALTPHPMVSWRFDKSWKQAETLYEDPHFISNLQQKKNNLIKRKDLIEIGNDVWIGYGVYISRGVKIGDGAIIAAGSVVVNDVPPYTIVGGVPAKTVKQRFSDKYIEKLLQLQWWDYGPAILKNIDITDMEHAIFEIENRISQGIQKYTCDKFEFNIKENTVYKLAYNAEEKTLIAKI